MPLKSRSKQHQYLMFGYRLLSIDMTTLSVKLTILVEQDFRLRNPCCRPVMHAGPFSFNRRRRAQNGTGAAAFGGVGREISKIIYNKKF